MDGCLYNPNYHFDVYCHHGMRSFQATRILKGMGYKKVRNLAGGIDAWAAKYDEKMPRY